MIATESHAPATLTPPRDPGGVIYNAINGTGFGVTVLPFYTNFWGGTWTAAAAYNSVDGTTTFTGDFGSPAGGGALGSSVKPGMVVVPNLHQPVALHIVEVSINLPGTDTLTVNGDARGLGGNGTRFRIHQQAPYKYDPGDDSLRANNPCEMNPRALWSGYRRLPWTWSRAGEDPYLAWNRMYLPEIGRWTSSDPAASPWSNLNGYVSNPIQGRDTTGLVDGLGETTETAGDWSRTTNRTEIEGPGGDGMPGSKYI